MCRDFHLWLEFEVGEPGNQPANRPTENHARYPWPYEADAAQTPAKYVIPPDLFVERLDRSTIESVVSEMIALDELRSEWLCADGPADVRS